MQNANLIPLKTINIVSYKKFSKSRPGQFLGPTILMWCAYGTDGRTETVRDVSWEETYKEYQREMNIYGSNYVLVQIDGQAEFVCH